MVGSLNFCPFHDNIILLWVEVPKIIQADGLPASVEATVNDRAGKIKMAMYEVAAIIKDAGSGWAYGHIGFWENGNCSQPA